MSGLNPFRPKKPEDTTGHQNQHHSSHSTSSPSIAPDPIFLGHLPAAAAAASQPNLPPTPSAVNSTPPPPINAPDLDDSVTSDNQTTSDPFDRDSDLSEDEAEAEPARVSSEVSMTASPGDLRPLQETNRMTPPSSTTTPFGGQYLKNNSQLNIENDGILRESTGIASSDVSSQRSASSEETDSNSTADEPQLPARIKTPGRPLSLGAHIHSGALTSRSGNRGRVPPPPPKSHHGKLISHDTSITLPASRETTPAKTANRVSFHGSSPGPLSLTRVSQGDSDYFGPLSAASLSAPPTDAVLRRSQSQHKRPPTPPLSRRHSQMGRSKSTLSKPTLSQLSMPPVRIEATTSTPSSPGSRSLTPSQIRDFRFDSSFPDETSSTLTPRSENVAPTPSTSSIEISGPVSQSNPQMAPKRSSLVNSLPPPPPRRRTRGTSNHSNDSNRPASLRSEPRADRVESFVPHPSNARDILADLSRLQKEVDDLRGHYASRGA